MGGVVGALVYLRVTSLRNAVISRFERLKQPKYLIGAVVGVAYFYFLIGRRMSAPRPRGATGFPQTFPAEQLPAVAALGALLLMMFVALNWLWPRNRAAVAFSEPGGGELQSSQPVMLVRIGPGQVEDQGRQAIGMAPPQRLQ